MGMFEKIWSKIRNFTWENFRKKEAPVKMEKIKKLRVTAKDIQKHIRWIDSEMLECEKDRQRYREILAELQEIDSENDKERYSKLLQESHYLEDADSRYMELQEQKEKEYAILKKYKDSKFFIAPKDLLTIVGISALSLYMITLERENPKSLKLATFILKLFPIKM